MEVVCYEVYLRAIAITDKLPTVDMVQATEYTRRLVNAIPFYGEDVLQLHLYYHEDGLGSVDYFLLHLIVNENWGYLHDQTEKGLLVRVKTMLVLRNNLEENMYDEYVMQIMTYNISFNDKMSSVYVPSVNDENSMDLLQVDEKYSYDSCAHKVVTFNKIRLCPYLEMPLNTYPLSVKNGNLVLDDSSANSMPVHTFELLQWEYMIKGDQLLICTPDMNRLLSALSKPVANSASVVLKRYKFSMYIIICLFCKIRYVPL